MPIRFSKQQVIGLAHITRLSLKRWCTNNQTLGVTANEFLSICETNNSEHDAVSFFNTHRERLMASLQTKNGTTYSLAHLASKKNNIGAIKVLEKEDIDLLYSLDSHNNNVLHVGVLNNANDVIEYLIRHHRRLLFQKNKVDLSPMQLIRDRVRQGEQISAEQSAFHRTVIDTAFRQQDQGILIHYHGLYPSLLSERHGETRRTVLHFAVENNLEDLARFALERNPFLALATNSLGQPPIVTSIIQHRNDFLTLLIKAIHRESAFITLRNRDKLGNNSLAHAVIHNNPSAVHQLLNFYPGLYKDTAPITGKHIFHLALGTALSSREAILALFEAIPKAQLLNFLSLRLKKQNSDLLEEAGYNLVRDCIVARNLLGFRQLCALCENDEKSILHLKTTHPERISVLLHDAIGNHSQDICKFILDTYTDTSFLSQILAHRNDTGYNAFAIAIASGNIEFLKTISQHRDLGDALRIYDENNSLLAKKPILFLALASKGDPKQHSNTAADTGTGIDADVGVNSEMLFYIRDNLDPDLYLSLASQTDDKGSTLLHAAALSEDQRLIGEFIEPSYQLLVKKAQNGETFLHTLAKLGAYRLIQHVQDRVSLEQFTQLCLDANQSGFTSLHCAAKDGHLEAVKILLNAAPTAVTTLSLKMHDSPLHLAVKNKHLPILEYFHSALSTDTYKSMMETKDKTARTTLISAVENDDIDMVQFIVLSCPSLLEMAGGDSTNLPVLIAARKKYPRIHKFLMSALSKNTLPKPPLNNE